MKKLKLFAPGFCLLIGGLLLAATATAQETDAPPANPEPAAATDAISNSAELAATNTIATNFPIVVSEPQGTVRDSSQPIVLFGQNAELKASESAETVVVIGGSATIHGHVREAVVVIGGDVEVDGDVGEAVVAVFGNVHLKPGARIRQDAVAVLGSVTAAPGVKVGGNAVAVGGKLELAEGAAVKGDKVNVGLPGPLANVDWLRNWFKYCVLEARPLAPQVGFVWIIAAVFFLIYLLVVAAFPRPIQTCVEDLNRRPATIFLMGLLTKLVVSFVYLILAITGVGLILSPIIWAALAIFTILGKVAILVWLGSRVGRIFGSGFQQPLVAFLLGSVIITLLYLVPVVGLLTYLIFGVWGLGSGVTAVFARLRHEAPQKPTPTVPPSPAGESVSNMAPPVIDPNAPATPGSETTLPSSFAPPIAPQAQPPTGTPPIAPDAASFPKAALWERVCAAFLDLVLVGILVGFAHAERFSLGLIVALVYFVGMWTWRGTTIGGIVLKLKVVRADGRPLTWIAALVRGLAAAFSMVIFFLGFLWIAWDKDKQGWHDKIAGTVVIRLPHSAPLVCL